MFGFFFSIFVYKEIQNGLPFLLVWGPTPSPQTPFDLCVCEEGLLLIFGTIICRFFKI